MEISNFNIVLVCPQIPNNTGNVGRLCVGSQSKLHLVHPLGFEITDTRVKRAGLDYWPDLDLTHHASFEKLLGCIPDLSRVFFLAPKLPSPITTLITGLEIGWFLDVKQTVCL